MVALLVFGGFGSASAAQADPQLATQAYGILKTYCYRCHGLRFDVEGYNVLNREILLTKIPEEDNELKYVVPGKPDASLMWQRAWIKKDMPPGNNPKPTAAEYEILKKWIEEGAPFPAIDNRKFVSEKDIYRIIVNDLRMTLSEDRIFRRYFTLTSLHNNSFEKRIGKNGKNFDGADLPLARAALSKLANSLSWEQEIVVPRVVDAGQAEVVLAVDLRDLGWDERNIWNEILKLYPYGLKQDVSTDDELRELSREVYELTGTHVPYLRVDWFIDTASRPPLYHTILNLPTTAQDLERQLKVDPDEDFLRDKLTRAGFAESGVSTSNRLVDRHPALYGAYWKSYDFAKSEGTGNLFQFPLGPKFDDNPFDRQAFEHAGGELIFNLPNGLQGYLLIDNVGNRIDKGPINIVRDLKETSGTAEVVNGISCMACHEHGMIRFKDTIRDGLGVFGDAQLKVRRLFQKPDTMTKLLDRDEQRFLQSLTDATGPFLQVGNNQQRNVKTFPEVVGSIARFYQKDLELEDVAAELGMPDPRELQILIKGNPRLRELGLGPLVQGAAIKRSTWQSLERSISPFQQAAFELELGTPHRSL